MELNFHNCTRKVGNNITTHLGFDHWWEMWLLDATCGLVTQDRDCLVAAGQPCVKV